MRERELCLLQSASGKGLLQSDETIAKSNNGGGGGKTAKGMDDTSNRENNVTAAMDYT